MDFIIINAGQRDAEDTSDMKANLIKDYNNGVLIVILTKLSHIIPDKHAIDSSARILANIINNCFRDLFPFSMALLFSPLLPSLAVPTTDNFGNTLITFTYYMLICMQDLVSSRDPIFFSSLFFFTFLNHW